MESASQTNNRYVFARNLATLQKQAGVEREGSELLLAYARLCADRGRPVEFYSQTDSAVPWNYALDKLLERNPNLDPRAQQFFVAYNRAMHSRRLPAIYSKEHLAARLDVTIKQLDWLAYSGHRYRTFHIPKSNGDARRVDEPMDKLKSVQRWILRRILNKMPAHKCAHGFRPKRSILTNARKHLRRQVIVRIDVEEFFPSITREQVRKEFQKVGYPYAVAHILASLCTREGVLPIGGPASPALANQVCRRMDNRLWLLVRDRHFRYTLYADDLVFSSSNRRFPALVPFLKQVMIEEGFRINERKLVIVRRDNSQKVTGIVVNRRTNVPEEQYKWLRAVVHNCRVHGVASQYDAWCEQMIKSGREAPIDQDHFGRQLAGRLAFVRHVNPKKGDRLWSEYQRLDFG